VRKNREERSGRDALLTGLGDDDQSYFLARLNYRQLARALFPLGEFTRDDVRTKAQELALPVDETPGSQDLCFLPAGDYRKFLRRRCPEACRPGPIVHVSGRELGRHDGIAGYTVGQRRGLGVAWPEPLYVVQLRKEDNAVVVGERVHIMRAAMTVEDVNWISPPASGGVIHARVKIRYNHGGAPARLNPLGAGRLRVEFEDSQEAPCPGQAAVFYSGERVLGGGFIAGISNGRNAT
jgi:tRNA-specific 2-thiouridylase